MPTRPAILGTARLGNFRLGYRPAALTTIRRTRVTLLVAGINVRGRMRDDSLTVHDVLNGAPNTCSFVLNGTAPTPGQSVRVSVNSDDPVLLFSGTIQQPELTYTKRSTQLESACSAIDDSARLNRRLPFGSWVNVSATTIALALLPPGFTGLHIEAGLPLVSIIFDGTATVMNAYAQLATLIGGYCYVEDSDVHLFLEEATGAPDPLDGTHGRFADDPSITRRIDDSQVRTRVYGKGHGEAVPVDLTAGESLVPIADAVMFNPLGGQAIAGTTPDGAASQIVRYTGVQLGLGGSLVGPGVTPAVALNVTAIGGLGIEPGVHRYGYTWVTAAGETLLSPLRSITTGSLSAPTSAPILSQANDGYGWTKVGWAVGGTVTIAYVFAGDATLAFCTAPGPSASIVLEAAPSAPGYLRNVLVFGAFSPDPNVVAVQVFASYNGGAFERCVYQPQNVLGGRVWSLVAGLAGGAIGPATLPTPHPELQQTALAGIAVGPTGTTGRNVYRTTAGGVPLQLLTALANNTQTTYSDAAADGSLGVTAPTGDTSGLSTSGSQTSNGGGFYTSGSMGFPADGAATVATSSAPVFTSASYAFVAADVGATLYLKSGTNWIPGRYLIVSAAGGAATLSAACASVASPTSAIYGVDYSLLPVPRLAFTDLVLNAGGGGLAFSSVLKPVGKNFIGNVINVLDGVGFTRQRVIVVSTSGAVGTADKVMGTVSSTGGSGNLGGANSDGAVATTAVPAGSPAILLASAAPFNATGGWALLDGGQVVRYTGVSGNTLTGVPVSGPGALLTTVPYGGHAVAAPALTGVTGLALAMLKGTTVHLWVQRDDLAAQAALIALEAAQGRVSDGIVEHLITDDRRAEASLAALCDADLALFSRPIVTVTYATRDTKTKSGKPIVIDLASPPIHETLTIQEVTISQIDQYQGTAPLFTVTASSVRFSLEDLLRHLAAGAGA